MVYVIRMDRSLAGAKTPHPYRSRPVASNHCWDAARVSYRHGFVGGALIRDVALP